MTGNPKSNIGMPTLYAQSTLSRNYLSKYGYVGKADRFSSWFKNYKTKKLYIDEINKFIIQPLKNEKRVTVTVAREKSYSVPEEKSSHSIVLIEAIEDNAIDRNKDKELFILNTAFRFYDTLDGIEEEAKLRPTVENAFINGFHTGGVGGSVTIIEVTTCRA